MIIEKFDFDLASVILDLKSGNYKEAYPGRETLLLFKQDEDLLDVSEINPFAKDFLDLCDGKTTLQTISEKLYEQYGQDMRQADFFGACVESVQVLGKKRFVESE
jgi:hypothetical protein